MFLRPHSIFFFCYLRFSDEDYFVCFASPTRAILHSKPPQNQFERHVAKPMGANKAGDIEYAGKEMGLFIFELAKGNPKNIEFLFSKSEQAIHEGNNMQIHLALMPHAVKISH